MSTDRNIICSVDLTKDKAPIEPSIVQLCKVLEAVREGVYVTDSNLSNVMYGEMPGIVLDDLTKEPTASISYAIRLAQETLSVLDQTHNKETTLFSA